MERNKDGWIKSDQADRATFKDETLSCLQKNATTG